MEKVKISGLELENVKRIKAISLVPTENGLTVIGGNNGQGKTSVLDAIAWALGGDRYKPSAPVRDGSLVPPRIRLTLNNGLVVERTGKNSSLKVTDPTGQRAGQQLLNSFVEELALNLPRFMESSDREKADTLLRIIGIGEQLHALEYQEKQLYNHRHAIGQIADQKKKYAREMPLYTGVPNEPVSAFELIQRQQGILAVNGENQRKRQRKEQYDRELATAQIAFDEARQRLKQAEENALAARQDALDLVDQSTAQIEADLQNIEAINIKVRANCDRERAEQEAEGYSAQYEEMTDRLEDLRRQKYELLNGAKLPLEGLSVDDGALTYQGRKWDAMSGADQLRVSTAIVRALNPQCGFVLLDKLEQMDMDTLNDFGQWLREQGLQAIATRVSTGGECDLIIEDGMAVIPEPSIPAWKPGQF